MYLLIQTDVTILLNTTILYGLLHGSRLKQNLIFMNVITDLVTAAFLLLKTVLKQNLPLLFLSMKHVKSISWF